MNSAIFITNAYYIISFILFLALVVFVFIKKIAPVILKNMQAFEANKVALDDKDAHLSHIKFKTVKDFENQKQYFQYLESKILLWNEAIVKRSNLLKDEQDYSSVRIKKFVIDQSDALKNKNLYNELVPQALEDATIKITDFFKKDDKQAAFMQKVYASFSKKGAL